MPVRSSKVTYWSRILKISKLKVSIDLFEIFRRLVDGFVFFISAHGQKSVGFSKSANLNFDMGNVNKGVMILLINYLFFHLKISLCCLCALSKIF
jgi:hypothetical protein